MAAVIYTCPPVEGIFMFPLQIELGIYAGMYLLFFLFVGVPVLAMVLVAARWSRFGTQLGLLRRRLGMSRPLGWAMGLVAAAGISAPFAVGSPPLDEPGELWFALGGVLYVSGVLVGGWALARRDHLRLIEETPTTDTGGYTQPGDVVELEGEAVSYEEPLTAPVTGEPALAYRYKVEERRAMGRRSHWVPVDHGRDGVRFAVDDGSGPAVVDPSDARLDFQDPEYFRVGSDEEAPEQIRSLNGSISEVDESDRVRYTEERIVPGESAYVLGEVVDSISSDGRTATVVGDGDTPLIVADRSEESLKRRLRWLVVYGGPGSVVATLAGFGVLLWLAGVV